MNKIDSNITLIDTYNRNPKDYIEDFKLWCEDCGYSYTGEDEDDLVAKDDWGISIKFMAWYYDNCQIEEQDFWDNLKDAMENRCLDCVVTGQLGLWDGRKSIVPVCMELMDAIYKCLKDAEYYAISIENNVMVITNCHHDGTNKFEIRLVNGENYDKLVYWDDDEDGDIDEFFKDENNFEQFYFEYFGI